MAAVKSTTQDGEVLFAGLQKEVSWLVEITHYLQTDELPSDKVRARELALTRSQYALQIYHMA